MKAALAVLVSLFVGYVLQTTFFPSMLYWFAGFTGLHILFGHTVDWALITVIYLSLRRDRLGAISWGILVGMLSGWFGVGWNGAVAAGFFLTACAGSFLRGRVFLKSFLSIALAVAAMSLFEGVIHLEAGQILNEIPGSMSRQLGGVLIQSAVNGIFAPFVFELLRMLDHWFEGSATNYRRRSLLEVEL